MKRFLSLLFFTLTVTCAWAQDKPEADKCEMVFKSTEHNFGKITDRNKVSHTFEFSNTGTYPIVITRMSTTCKCTKYEFSKRPVPPGGKGYITVTYNPKKQSGVFYKVIQVFSNCSQERMILTVRGETVDN